MSKEVTILLVEDDRIDVMAIKRALAQCKIANPLVVAEDGFKALDILRGVDGKPALESPYFIILDLNMPRMNGLEFLEALRADPQLHQSVVFVMTTSQNEQDRAAAYENHIAGFITKMDFDKSFVEAVTMLECFWKIVELP